MKHISTKSLHAAPASRFSRLLIITFIGATLLLQQKATAEDPVDLGSATGFAILAGTGIVNVGASIVTGDVGSSPVGTTAGFENVTLTGTNHGNDAFTVAAKLDLLTAYNDAASRVPTTLLPAAFDLGGSTLTTGVFRTISSFALTGILTLDGQNNPDAVWIFQAGSTLNTTAASTVSLINGAKAANVFWQVTNAATLGANTDFSGSILAQDAITLGAGTTVDGRVMAVGGTVSMDTNTIETIPEPSTYALLALAAIGFGTHIIRRKARLIAQLEQLATAHQ